MPWVQKIADLCVWSNNDLVPSDWHMARQLALAFGRAVSYRRRLPAATSFVFSRLCFNQICGESGTKSACV
jgi:hypothetical protein